MRVTLRGVRPPVWRRLKVRSNTSLEDFHRILQDVMGWTDSHMHAFRPAGARVRAAVESNKERRTPLDELLRKPKDRLVYEYDFGDSWEHDVVLERVLERVLDQSPGERYPWVLGGARACPPEDVGGVAGYAHFLQAMLTPRHPQHEEMIEWHGGPFDPATFDAQGLNRAFHGGWAPAKTEQPGR